MFSATFWHEITLYAIDIDKKRFRTPFLTLYNHFENWPFTILEFPQHLRMTHIEANDWTQNRADFWALAGIAAVDKGIENANEDCDSDDCAVPDSGLTFQWGRQVGVPGIRDFKVNKFLVV